MGEFTRYSLTGVLYFPYVSRGNLGAYLAKFTKGFKKYLLSTSLFDSEEFSVSIDKVNDLNFIPRTEDKDRFFFIISYIYLGSCRLCISCRCR